MTPLPTFPRDDHHSALPAALDRMIDAVELHETGRCDPTGCRVCDAALTAIETERQIDEAMLDRWAPTSFAARHEADAELRRDRDERRRV